MPNDFEKFGDITSIKYKKVLNYKKKYFSMIAMRTTYDQKEVKLLDRIF